MHAGDGDDEREMNDHGDDKADGDKDDPFAVTDIGTHLSRICLGPTLGGDQAHCDTQAQGGFYGGAAYLLGECMVTGFAESPRKTRLRYTLWFHQANGMEKDARGTH